MVTVPLYRLKKRTPPAVWFVAFLLTCFLLPFVSSLRMVHPGLAKTIATGWEIAKSDLFGGLIFVTFFVFLLSIFMFVVNGAFVFMRVLAGYDVRRNSSILKWIYLNFMRRRYSRK